LLFKQSQPISISHGAFSLHNGTAILDYRRHARLACQPDRGVPIRQAIPWNNDVKPNASVSLWTPSKSTMTIGRSAMNEATTASLHRDHASPKWLEFNGTFSTTRLCLEKYVAV